MFVIVVVLVNPVASPPVGVCCRGSDASFYGGARAGGGALSVEEVSSVDGIVFFSSLLVDPVEQPGPIFVEELVSLSKFGWGSRVADGD